MPVHRVRVHAPAAGRLDVGTAHGVVGARIENGEWIADVEGDVGDHYWLIVDGGAPLLDPSCWALAHTAVGPRSVLREPWGRQPRGAPLASPAVVYELHVRGFGRTFRGCVEHLDHVVDVGANVIELMPVHPFDDSDNYWGYMPLVWGAVHGGYAAEPVQAAEELAELTAAAHDRGMHVWLDVVFNHTGEGDASLPARSLRGLDDLRAYLRGDDGTYTNDSGCGNDINPAHPYVRRLVMEALDRFVDLGIDGFRFDLATLLGRDGGGLIAEITAWSRRRNVTLVAEPWDLATYAVGSPMWPPDWLQWNDRFRDDVRGFLRGDPGLVSALRDRVQGSPDLFADGARSALNFVTAHDGLTMHDLTTQNSDKHRAWDCGDALRAQQLKNYFAILLLSAGTPMWVMGDEFGRTQHGHDNPYDIDGPLSWIDWGRARSWAELTRFVKSLVLLRRQHPPDGFRFYGATGSVDESHDSHTLAWCAGDLYVMVNAGKDAVLFTIQEPGEWHTALETAPRTEESVAAHSIVVLAR